MTTVAPVSTLPTLLAMRASVSPDRLAYRFLKDSTLEPQEISYAELYLRASAIAEVLVQVSEPGAPVLVLCPPGLEYIASLWGCLLAGRIAVPSLPPRFNRASQRFDTLVADTRARLALATRAISASYAEACAAQNTAPTLRIVAVEDIEPAQTMFVSDAHSGDLAVLQYTSGSTSAPRGVMLSHAHLLENCARSIEAANFDSESQLISWLPPYHDMGLIGTILLAPTVGCHATMMSPISFITHPVRWLEAITRYRGTHGGAPDFAYALSTQRIDAAQRSALDLSSWCVAWNGAERIRPSTIDAFCSVFEPVGFSRKAMRPCYGLAESTLIVSFTDQRGPQTFAASEAALQQHRAERADSPSDTTLLVSSGTVVSGHAVVIVDPQTRELQAAAAVGEIWVRGPSVAYGYYEKPVPTEATFQAKLATQTEHNWLRTGDLGFLRDGELYVTGRLKDLLVVRGRNFYPDDLERTAQIANHAARPNCGAAFSIEVDGEERVCLVQEVSRKDNLAQVAEDLSAAVLAEHELMLHDLWLVRAGQIPKTSSGKIQRAASKQMFLKGTFSPLFKLRQSPPVEEAHDHRFRDLVSQECCALLGLKSIDQDTDLFSLGVQSVLAMQLAARLEQALGIDLPLRALFEAKTVAQLASRIAVAERKAPLPAIEVHQAQSFPLSLAQERMWVEHAFDPTASAYNISGALVLRGPCDVSRLTDAVEYALKQHDILRTRYLSSEHGITQRVDTDSAVSVEQFDVNTLEAAIVASEALARKPFDLEAGPIIRVALFRVSERLHVLTFVVHHIAADGISLDLATDAVFSRYESAEASAAPSPRVRYLDFAHWQRRILERTPVENAVAYWKTKLQGAPALLDLPLDYPRPPRRTLRGSLVKRRLSLPLTQKLDAFCEVHHVTRYMALLSAFYVLLQRSTGESDLSVGTPTTGRHHPQTENLVGTFVNMLVMRTFVDGSTSFGALVSQVQEVVLEAFEHRDAPFERVVEAVSPIRSQAHTPLFQVMFDYQSMRNLRGQVADLEVEPHLLNRAASQYDLSMSILETREATLLHLEFRNDLFEQVSAERLADRFFLLLESAFAHPDDACSKLPWLLPNEREALLQQGRGPTPSVSHSEIFLDAFEANVARIPDRPAARDGSQSLSYGSLDARANLLAQRLKALGVGPNVAVAVYLDRRVELLVTLLAVLKAGGAYVPLDPVYPAFRIAMVLEDASPHLVITERALLTSLPEYAGTVFVLEDEQCSASQCLEAPSRSDLVPSDLAYIIFTSGSTGRPKGVEISHVALANFLSSMAHGAHTPGLTQADRLLAVTTVSFDIAGLEFFLPLCVGAELELASKELAADGVALAERLQRGDITCLQATPATFRMLVEVGFEPQPKLKLLCGGEALPRDLANALVARAGAKVFNMYGPTETTIWSTCSEVVEGDGPVPLGTAIDHTFLYIVDEQRNPTPWGVAGELIIGGKGVARGYHRRPDLTQERFIQDPFSEDPAARAYRTGDAARFRHDGTLEFLGRMDQQVKLRGFRVELGEIESQLLRLPAVETCAVKLFSLSPQDARLVAYIVKTPGAALVTPELQASLRGYLPEYMVPSFFVELPTLPLTPNGKVDRRALLAPTFETDASRPFVAPRDVLETTVCTLFEEVLGRSPVGITDSFFDLGGHSILAVRLFEKLAAKTGHRLALSALFDATTPLALALLVRAKQSEKRDPRRSYTRKLSNSDSNARLLCIHPDGTGPENALSWYEPLARELSIESIGVACDEDAYVEIEEIANRHVAAVRHPKSAQPLYLMGVGLGGNIAQAMAVALEAQGVNVARVVIIQSLVPETFQGISLQYARKFLPNIVQALRQYSALLPHERITRHLVLTGRMKQSLARPKTPRSAAFEDIVDLAALPACYQSLSAPQWNALRRHHGKPCQAPITLVRARRTGLVPLDEAHGFAKLSLSPVDVRILDCRAEALLRHDFDAALLTVLKELVAEAKSHAPAWSIQAPPDASD